MMSKFQPAKLTEVLDMIQKDTTRTSQWEDPNYLSDLVLRLASYYSSLGPLLADAEEDEATAKVEYEVKRERIKVDNINAKKAVKLSESIAVTEVAEDMLMHIKLKHKARLLFLTRQSLDKTMDGIRSSLAQKGRDKEGSRHAV